MAIDTAPKRRAAAAILTGLLIVGVTPDATPGADWRAQAGWGYSGIAVAEPQAPATPPTVGDEFVLTMRIPTEPRMDTVVPREPVLALRIPTELRMELEG